jgi:CheY-like chemotaxis protein
VTLVSFIDRNVPTQLVGDAARLRQILDHILGNAVKFTERGRIALSVRLEGEGAGKARLRFSVRDTGPGISAEAQRHVFEPFMQADSSAARRHGGAGLGLAICRQLVERMGGTIGVRSAPGRGTHMWFVLPFQASGGLAGFERRSLENVALLVVDDNSAQRHYLHRQLQAWGARDYQVPGAAEALRVLRRQVALGDPLRLALIDLGMPQTDGIALARAIKSDSALSATRLILMSSAAQAPDSLVLKSAGIDGHIVKPLKFGELLRLLAPMPSDAVAVRARSPSELPRILVAEDNQVNQIVAVRQLERLGYAPETVENGLEALKALDETSYDVVLMDCQMPEMDGYQATAEIRRRESGRKHTTIIAMTAHALKEDRDRCLAAGMDDYISKPVTSADLETALGRWVGPPPQRAKAVPAAVAEEAVDLERLTDLSDGKRANLLKLIQLYVRTTSEQMEKLDRAIDGNAQEVEHVAHSCAGSSSMVGMNALVKPLRDVENWAAKGDLSRAARALVDVRRALQQINAFLQAHQLSRTPILIPAERTRT